MKKYIQPILSRIIVSLILGTIFALLFHFIGGHAFLRYFYMGTLIFFVVFTFFVHYKDFRPFFFGPEEWKDKEQ